MNHFKVFKNNILFNFFFIARNNKELKILEGFSKQLKLDIFIYKEKHFYFIIIRTFGIKQTRIFYKDLLDDFDFRPTFFVIYDLNTKSAYRYVYLKTLEIFLNPISEELYSTLKFSLKFIMRAQSSIFKAALHKKLVIPKK